eukprot:4775557-Pyramimonas_sp.AAC.2
MERRIREEARHLRDGTTMEEDGPGSKKGAEGAAAAGRRLLELDALAFQQGGHLMSNKRCELPAGSYRTCVAEPNSEANRHRTDTEPTPNRRSRLNGKRLS